LRKEKSFLVESNLLKEGAKIIYKEVLERQIDYLYRSLNITFIPFPKIGKIFSKEKFSIFPKNKISMLRNTKGIINKLLLYKALYFKLHVKKAQIKKAKTIKNALVFG